MSQTFDFALGNKSCCTIYEPPAIIKWGSFGMYNFRKYFKISPGQPADLYF